MACKKPVIISKGVGASEVLVFPRTIIVEEKSPEQITDAVMHLLGDKRYYEKVAQVGFKFVSNNFDYKQIADELVSKLKTL